VQEKEREKQRLIFEQTRLATRGAAEMVLYSLSSSRGEVSETVMASLQLGIALLTGGNQDIQKVPPLSLLYFPFCAMKWLTIFTLFAI